MFCYNCGVEIRREHKFCFSCGIRLEFNHPAKNGRATITKLPTPAEVNAILKDPNTIHYKRKIEACINNAITFDRVIKRHGTFSNYIESFGNLEEDRTLDLLKKDLMQFDYVGPITAYHVMLDLGLKVWRPDRVIRRILFRLGLISGKENIEQSIAAGKEFARQLGEPIRYIDIVMVKYGQMGDEEGFGLAKGGICLEKNPRCQVCVASMNIVLILLEVHRLYRSSVHYGRKGATQ